MKRWNVLILCAVVVCLVGAGKKQLASWEMAYTPTRLEWLALQCSLHHTGTDAAQVSFLAMHPNKLEVIIKLAPASKSKDAKLRQEIQEAAKEYATKVANAMGWKDPLEVDAIEVVR